MATGMGMKLKLVYLRLYKQASNVDMATYDYRTNYQHFRFLCNKMQYPKIMQNGEYSPMVKLKITCIPYVFPIKHMFKGAKSHRTALIRSKHLFWRWLGAAWQRAFFGATVHVYLTRFINRLVSSSYQMAANVTNTLVERDALPNSFHYNGSHPTLRAHCVPVSYYLFRPPNDCRI